jgi:hypothetical protein
MKKAVVGFGRMNPSTTGHEVVAKKIQDEAKKRNAEARLYLSHTTNPKKDPLPYDDKIKFATAAFKHLVKVIKSPARTIIEVAVELEKEGFTEMTVVVGEDRVREFNNLLQKYNGKDFNFEKIEVIKAGDRDPDADDVTGMSASKMRKLATEGDFESFSKGAPSKLSKAMVKQMYDKVRKNMRIAESIEEACWPGYTQKGMKKKGDRMVPNCVPEENEVEEAVLSFAQRRQRGMRLRRMQKRIQRARSRQMKRFADPARLRRRAMKAAFKALRSRFSGGKDYASMGTAEKIGLDKRLQKALPMVKKLAVRLLPTVRKREILRKRSAAQHANEMFEEIMLERTSSPQDKDIKGKEGTQPSKYHSGLAKSTKEKRDAHFKKYAEKPDSDPSSYKDAPGDKEAREKGMRPSVHTIKFKKMFGEEVSKKELGRLDMLVRMGLADKKLLQVIKRAVTKLDSGETLMPQERQAAFDLLQTLLDMTLSTDQLFRMTRMQLQKEDVFGIGSALSPLTHSKDYADAKKALANLLKRKGSSGKDKLYYAAQVAKSYDGVDAKKLARMVNEDWDDPSRDGISMAQIELENLIDDAEEILEILEGHDEEPDQWVLSKITKANDYISSARDYLDYSHYDDDEEEDEDDEEDDEDEFDDEMIDDAISQMINDGLTTEEYEFIKPISEEIDGLKKKAEKSGIAYGILKKVYDRGMAAWKSGHRPGATPQQWAFARVNSFITKGKGTWGGADKDLASKVSTNEEFKQKFGPLEIGTDKMRIAYARMTPGQNPDLVTAKYDASTALNVLNDIRTQRAKKLFDENKNVVKEAIEMHIDKKIPFVDNVFRVGSEKYFEFFREARAMNLQLEGHDKYLIEETDIGEIVEFEGQMVPLDCPMVEEWEDIDENLNIFSKWRNKEPVEYAKYLTKHFGVPDELTEKRAVWYDKDGFKRIEVLDEFILHASPVPHYDFVYCYADIKVSHDLADDLAKSSESITVDFLKNEVGARCASLTANAVTLNYVIEVVEGRVKPSKQEYERQIKSMKNKFASGKKFELDWWPDESGDADPKNPYYNKNIKEEDEKDPPLNKPKRGGPKKFYVYVRKPDGGIKKVTWGDTTGLSVKMNDPEARKSFAARHQCSTQKDRTSAAYWACNTPRYAKQLGLAGGGSFYW